MDVFLRKPVLQKYCSTPRRSQEAVMVDPKQRTILYLGMRSTFTALSPTCATADQVPVVSIPRYWAPSNILVYYITALHTTSTHFSLPAIPPKHPHFPNRALKLRFTTGPLTCGRIPRSPLPSPISRSLPHVHP